MKNANKDKNVSNQNNISGNKNQKQPLQNPGHGQSGSRGSEEDKHFSKTDPKRPQTGSGAKR